MNLKRSIGPALLIILGFRPGAAVCQDSGEGSTSLAIAYTLDAMGGGEPGNVAAVDNLDIIFDHKQGDTTLHLYGLYNNGKSYSADRFRRGYVASNIETGVRAVRLYEAWIQHSFADGKLSVRAGLYDLNSEFDMLEASGLFINPAHGIGTDFSQSGANGPSIFPSTSLALRVEAKPHRDVTLRAAVLDGVPGDPANPARTAIRLGGGDGALMAFEAELCRGSARIIAGHWRYTASFGDPLASFLATVPVISQGNQGFYLRGEARLAGKAEGRNLRGFFRLGTAAGQFNEVRHFASGGLNWRGPFAARRDDLAGIAVAWGGASSRAMRLEELQGGQLARNEWSFEAAYAFRVLPWLTLQPDLQYVMNPAFDPGRRNWVASLRTEIAWSFGN